MRRFLDGLYLGAGYLAGAFLVVIFALMMIMSVGRQFGLNIPSGDDFAAWSMAAMAFLGLAHTFKAGEMIRVGLLLEKLPQRGRWVFEILALSVTLGFVAFFAYHAWNFVRFSWIMHEMSNGVVAVPMWIPQISFLAGIALLGVAVVDELVHVLKGNNPSFERPPPKTTEELLQRIAEGGGV